MNEITQKLNISHYQLNEFQTLIEILFQCCQDRQQFLSDRFKLPDAHLRCLLLFEEHKYLTAKNISKKMNIVKSRAAKIISGLLKTQFVKRIIDPEDSRSMLIRLTPEGINKVKSIRRFQMELHRIVLSHVDDEERKKLLNALALLKGCMETGKEFMTRQK